MVEDQLPFGGVDEEDLSDSPNDPLVYAEAHLAEHITLQWQNPDARYARGPEFKIVLSPLIDDDKLDLLQIIARKNIRTSRKLTKERAQEILIDYNDGAWDYAE